MPFPTIEQVYALPVGAALDRAVAIAVFGLKDGVDFGQWPEHLWKNDETETIDLFVLYGDHHNGPGCTRCDLTFCHHCETFDEQGPCVVEPHMYSTISAQALAVFWQMIENTGSGEISADMEDYGREPGKICSVTFADRQGGSVTYTGDFCAAVCRCALLAMAEPEVS